MNVAMKLFTMIIITLVLAACGGGDGGGAFIVPQPASSKTTAVLKIATQRVSGAEEQLAGVSVDVTLPKGVTVAIDGSGNVAPSAAVPSGVAIGRSILTAYTPATATANAKLNLTVNAGGTLFGTGEFVTVTCNLPAGNSLQPGDFSTAILSNLQPFNAQLQPAAGLVPSIAATLL